MAVAMNELNNPDLGPTTLPVNDLIRRIERVDWFTNMGQTPQQAEAQIKQVYQHLNLSEPGVYWLSQETIEEEMPCSLTNSELWAKLQPVPAALQTEAERLNRQTQLDYLVYQLPELIFHKVYHAAFTTFERVATIQFITGHAIYLCTMACIWELLSDQKEWSYNPYKALFEIYEAGHVPLGMDELGFYLL
ncbi:hypothetical protein [Salsuginibacillus kocurii]|uniref:hypothetical protein n=1 Tax=Salsuginibacillus kocurii TaxID=427078 RepID=UPI0003811DBC|nr:hypothetical protein [Salsuginibacillus kocurii]